MKSAFLLKVGLFLTTLMTPSFLWANNAIEYFISLQHLAEDEAELKILAHIDSERIDVSLKHCQAGDKALNFKIERLKSGESKSFRWKQSEGRYACQLHIQGLESRSKAPWSAQAQHEVLALSKLELLVNLRELKQGLEQLDVGSNRPVNNVKFQVISQDGSLLAEGQEQYQPERSQFRLSWHAKDQTPAFIEIYATDAYNAWAKYSIFFYEIPHTDIAFDNAKSELRQDQEHYLHESLLKIQEVYSKHNARVAMDLYITGYTDTVGSHASNDKLSQARAKTIAAWFKKRGVPLNIYYRGLGERVLAVPTADNTPMEANRRASYILSNAAPQSHKALASWQKL